jgi:hypothetical protein
MSKVRPGRYTADLDGDFVVFVIGMRVNHLRKIHRWFPVMRRMGPMIRELNREPAKGMLHVESAIVGRTTLMVQYWRSYDDLERFAKDGADLHLPAWRAYNKAIASSGDVGVYHETYKVRAGDYEAVYANMTPFGLARAGEMVPVSRKGESSRERISAGAS